ncbi:MAG TPA: hypothetical protein VG944_13140 [Fimbriimonas sp.]|nr:hypothetical protein [Fimbriimonas sp.]
MSNRRSNIFNDIARDMLRVAKNRKLGKIERNPYCGYVLGDQGWTNPSGVFLKPCKDNDGRDISLTKGSFANNCPQPPAGAEATPRTNKGFWVKVSACNKCPFHLPGMCCSLLREQGKNAHREAFSEFANCVMQATEQVKEIMR